MRPGGAREEIERHPIAERQQHVGAKAEFAAHIGRIGGIVAEPETAARNVRLAIGGRVKELRLHGCVGDDLCE
jgi:hypothetical protein